MAILNLLLFVFLLMAIGIQSKESFPRSRFVLLFFFLLLSGGTGKPEG